MNVPTISSISFTVAIVSFAVSANCWVTIYFAKRCRRIGWGIWLGLLLGPLGWLLTVLLLRKKSQEE